MNIPLLNLLGDTVLLRRQRRLRFYLIATYSVIWLFSIFALIYTYRTNLFISTLYKRDIAKMNHEISLLQPKLLVIEQLYHQRRSNLDKISLYQQNAARPSAWAQKLQAISQLIPLNMRLAEISLASPTSAGKKQAGASAPRLKMSGLSLIDPKQQDLNFINILKKDLETDSAFISEFNRIEIMQNKIEIKDGQPRMTFVMAAY
ncbi:MAG: hypothetical protein WC957_01480 [Candidatus Neomarinimicrobiota bacterium]|jgi:Tfp pilus assembly protein PilN